MTRLTRILTVTLFILLIVLLLAACAGSGDPVQTVQRYLQAKTSGDQTVLQQTLCAEMEAVLEREVMSFDGVDARLENVACLFDADAATVTCSGAIIATYGGEDNTFPLGTYHVVQEAGEWKWCGEAE